MVLAPSFFTRRNFTSAHCIGERQFRRAGLERLDAKKLATAECSRHIKMHQAIALSLGLIEASSPLTSAAGLGGLKR